MVDRGHGCSQGWTGNVMSEFTLTGDSAGYCLGNALVREVAINSSTLQNRWGHEMDAK